MKKVLLILILHISLTSLFSIDYLNIPDEELVFMAENGDSEAIYQLALLIEDLQFKENKLRLNYIDTNIYNWLEKATALGHPKASTKIGKEYLSDFGYYKKKDLDSAIKYLKVGAEAGDNEAQLLLSVIYYHGLGTESDKELAKLYLHKSQEDLYRVKPLLYLETELINMIRLLAMEKNSDALFILGDFYYFGKNGYYEQNYKNAFRLYSQSADLGNSSASYMMGMMIYNGVGVLKDLNESFIYITKSAELGNKAAMIKSAIMNYFGEGTSKNIEKAFALFSETALLEDSLSQYFLGVMYYKGEGTDSNLELSKKWIKKAFENGSDSAKKFWDSKELWK